MSYVDDVVIANSSWDEALLGFGEEELGSWGNANGDDFCDYSVDGISYRDWPGVLGQERVVLRDEMKYPQVECWGGWRAVGEGSEDVVDDWGNEVGVGAEEGEGGTIWPGGSVSRAINDVDDVVYVWDFGG